MEIALATIEISGPDAQGQYTVEVESDEAESAEQGGGVDPSASDPSGGAGDPGSAGPTGDDSGQDGSNSVTCGSVKEVLQTIKQILQGGSAQAPSGQDVWNQEAGKSAAARQQANSY